MREEYWHPLVRVALVRSLDLRPELCHDEVPTREGSIADLVYASTDRLVMFETKMAEAGQALAALGSRDLRQLRHFQRAANAVYLVTACSPRSFALGHDGRVVLCQPLELQALPEGVGWVAFDRLGLEAAVLAPAPELRPDLEDRQFVVNHLLGRLSRASKQLRVLAGAVA